jgi:hypothetical protein
VSNGGTWIDLKAESFNVELSDLDIREEDLVKVFGHQFKA